MSYAGILSPALSFKEGEGETGHGPFLKSMAVEA